MPKGKRALPCRWLFKYKYDENGYVERYKARLVVIGCRQMKYVDFEEIFVPVVRMESVRVLLAIMCIEDLECDRMDIDTGFLSSELEEVYILQPEGTAIQAEKMICR